MIIINIGYLSKKLWQHLIELMSQLVIQVEMQKYIEVKKQKHTMNVLTIFKFVMKFIYAYIGVPCKTHDTKY